MMTITIPYNIGDVVFLKTDPEQLERIVHKVIITPRAIMVGLAMGITSSEHYEFEITSQKDLMKELNISGYKSV